jgi:C_GCAxxG_C_C family probable redox protein
VALQNCSVKKYTCSQAVFATYALEFGVDKETALKLACSFGGGMGCMGMTCGAVTGAYMVISLKHGRIAPEDNASREKSDELVKLFTQKFKERHDSKVNCNDTCLATTVQTLKMLK